MKQILFLTIAFIFLLEVAQAETQSHATEEKIQKFTWMDCVRETAKNNPDLEAARHALENADSLRKGSYSEYFPQVSVDAGATLLHRPVNSLQSSGDSGASSFGGPSSHTEYVTRYSANLNVEQKIFDGLRREGNVGEAKAKARVALAELALQKSLISYELKSAFAQLLYAQNLIEISKKIVQSRELDYHLVELRYEGGKENKGSLLLSKANWSQARFDLSQAQRNLTVSQKQLNTTMGRPFERPLVAEGELVTAPFQENPDFQSLALKTPSHFQRSAQADATSAGVTIARSGWFPEIAATGTVSRLDTQFFPKSNGWSVGVTATWPLFDGGKTYFNVKAARASLQQALAVLRSTDDQTALSLAQDYKDLVDAIEKVRVEKERLEAVQLRAQVAEAQYRNGLISYQDFETITNDFINQERNALASQRDALIAEAAWEQSQGIGAIP